MNADANASAGVRGLVLASRSGIRRQLLEEAGILLDVDPADVDEAALVEDDPDRRARRLALAKALLVSARRPGRLVLGSDQVLEVGGTLPEKPESTAEALAQLKRMNGAVHTFHCGLALVEDGRAIAQAVDVARVRFARVGEAELEAYAAGGEGVGCAGAYRLEAGGARFIEHVDGSHFTVLGLPLLTLFRWLRAFGLVARVLKSPVS